MNTHAIKRFMEVVRTRRALLGGVAAAGTAFAAIEDGGARPKQAKQRRRRRRGRQNGGGNGLGESECDVCSRGCRFNSIQAALDFATFDGTVIVVCPGNYPGGIEFDGLFQANNMRLQGAGAGQSVIDAEGHGTAITVSNASATVTGFTVTGGEAAFGGRVVNRGALAIDQCVIADNATGVAKGGGGGGIYNNGGTLPLRATQVSDNTALDGRGGGIQNAAGGRLSLEQGSQVTENQAERAASPTSSAR